MADSSSPKTVLQVFLFTDLVDFTDFKRRLGDVEAAVSLSRHDTLFRDCLNKTGGIEQVHTGDGFFATFNVPSEAVQCALAFQQGLAAIDTPAQMEARVGIHMGEIVQVASAQKANGRNQLVGLAIDTASRVMGLAMPGQILLTRPTFESARQQVQFMPDGSAVEWLDHGYYFFKGIEDAAEVCEVGIRGMSPMSPPKDSEKARRAITAEDEEALGGRTTIDADLPEQVVLSPIENDGDEGETFQLVRVATASETKAPPACPRCKGRGKDSPWRRLFAAALFWCLGILVEWCENEANLGIGARYFGPDSGVVMFLRCLYYVPAGLCYYQLLRMLWAFLGGRCPACKGTGKDAKKVTQP